MAVSIQILSKRYSLFLFNLIAKIAFVLSGIPDERMDVCSRVQKVFGDLYQALAGPVFVDSGSIDFVWETYHPFLLDALGKTTH